jgi:hypothetical protein
MDIDGNSEINRLPNVVNGHECVYFQEGFRDEIIPMLNAFINADSEEHAIKKTGEIRIRFKHANIFPAHLTDLRTIEGKKFHPSTCEEIII